MGRVPAINALWEALAARGRTALMLYCCAGFLGSVLLVVVWQKTPLGTAVEEFIGIRPAAEAVVALSSEAPPNPTASVGALVAASLAPPTSAPLFAAQPTAEPPTPT